MNGDASAFPIEMDINRRGVVEITESEDGEILADRDPRLRR